ncbi:Thioredoxin reductase [Chryseobacterium formosense]|uniref:NAD(P)/FAD-dependent oxidoreductase n=1 Tax=Chryseobacterium formosense TaxID=236814 RepID=UPI0008E6CB68|nr:NAD(P)/FAD-dependent oxidoreductase [Chryseobacterium formosense]SFT47508.1 Thioredoxin reductase [Chryseobacterium formosense]
MKNKDHEVIIIGGSFSGLSAALTLGRMLRKVLIIDYAQPCNRNARSSQNFLTNDGESPLAIIETARTKLSKYSNVKLIYDLAVSIEKREDGFKVTTMAKEIFRASKLIYATGIKDHLPSIDGFHSCWGISAIHCPYCHGYEYRGKRTAILANGEAAINMTAIVKNLTNEVIILTDGPAELDQKQLNLLKKNNVPIIETSVEKLVHNKGQIEAVNFTDGHQIKIDVLYNSPACAQHSVLTNFLAIELTNNGLIKVDHSQQTTVPGIYACGDNCTAMRTISQAIFTGNLAAAKVNTELTDENFYSI